jgi:hypothetical protein
MPNWFKGKYADIRDWIRQEIGYEKLARALPRKDTVSKDRLKEFIEKHVPTEVEIHNDKVIIRDRPVVITNKKEPYLHKADERVWAETADIPEKDWKNWKPTNPKDLLGVRKASLCCVSGPVLYEVALGMQEGAMKYGRHNYRSEGVAFSTYMDAANRHLWDCWEGEDIDPLSGVHHISKAISCLFVLRDSILNAKCTDDRPIKPRNPNWLTEINDRASALVDKYPQPEAPYCHIPMRGKDGDVLHLSSV